MTNAVVCPALTIVLSLGTPSFAQAPAFEVASIKPNITGARSTFGFGGGGRFTATNMTLKGLMQFAWNLRDYQISGGPAWAGSEGFDIVAAPSGRFNLTPGAIDTGREMLRSLLVDHFRLMIRRDTKELPIYALMVAKDGSKISAVEKPEHPADMRVRGGAGEFIAQKMNMNVFTQQALRDIVGRPVVDKTGLTGYYDFKLEWAPDQTAQPAADDRPDIFTALREQLGLRLDAEKGPVDILAIVSAEIPSNLDPQ
jgi:uncharacterized protein (TIGR03435 family)